MRAKSDAILSNSSLFLIFRNLPHCLLQPSRDSIRLARSSVTRSNSKKQQSLFLIHILFSIAPHINESILFYSILHGQNYDIETYKSVVARKGNYSLWWGSFL